MRVHSVAAPEEKPVGFRLKPPTLIHGQAPSTGVPSQKPKEQQRSVLRPAVLQAPPAKTFTESNSSCGTNGVSDGASESQNNGEKSDKQVEENSTANDSARRDSQSGGTNYFLQYIGTPSSQKATNNTDKEAKFVFGQNMSERVLSPPKGGESVESSRDSPAPVSEPSSQEATPEKAPAAPTAAAAAAAPTAAAANSVAESLEESAAAYTKATAKKCILEKVEVRTGEESESNVLQMQCKLFVFDKTAQLWIERGRGLLRLNDMASTEDGMLQSRLVMRTQGSLRLILNTKLWPQMQVDKASEKSVRITAMDTEDQGVKVFLISASSKDAGQLAAALHHRILALKSRAEQEPESAPPGPEPEVPQSNEDDSDDEPKGAVGATANTSGTSEGGEAQEAGGT
ncbi:ran-binding protein 3 [Clupea harengus]|uniref:Ran-binding protein 3 n=1 Tax=Clupea harengus TaxID=7950 RepID=A0A8M1K9X8_CLUHA|nr:ran-binding protein 3 [Clupea harengus]